MEGKDDNGYTGKEDSEQKEEMRLDRRKEDNRQKERKVMGQRKGR